MIIVRTLATVPPTVRYFESVNIKSEFEATTETPSDKPNVPEKYQISFCIRTQIYGKE